jgi:GH25 family lysozyme M1 (1,4-beta-N-acetylmuramidase)
MPADHTGKPLRFWLAAYASDPERYAPAFTRPHLWAVQYTDTATVAGIGNPSDYSYLK